MKTTTYICDKCKKSVGAEDLIEIQFSAILIKKPNLYNSSQTIKKDICKKCLEEKGLIVEFDQEKYEQNLNKNEKTIENKILEFLEDLGVVFQE